MKRQRRYQVHGASGIIEARVKIDPRDGPPLREGQGGGSQVREFSYRSRMALVRAALRYPWDQLGPVALVSLTYGADWPRDGRAVKSHVKLLWERWRHDFGVRPRGLWVMEFQHRGAPHYHCFMELPRGMEWRQLEAWGFMAWSRVVGQTPWAFDGVDEEHHRRMRLRFNVSEAWYSASQTAYEVSAYLSNHAAKWAQKQVPAGFENVGRFWGVLGLSRRRQWSDVCCQRSFVEVMRVVRKLYPQKGRHRGVSGGWARLPQGNGDELVGRLVVWANGLCPVHGGVR